MSSFQTKEICSKAPVVPVITVKRVEDAVPMAQALVAGGLPVLEVTLRTAAALDAIKAMRDAVPDAVVGAGTLKTAQDVAACMEVGAAFGVSPGSPPDLLDAVEAAGMPFLPGCASATEAMVVAARGYEVLKFFPAEAAGGIPFLKGLSSPLPDIHFCPTGGVSPTNAPSYLALPNVVCVGGSWVLPNDAIDAGDWARIEALARDASKLVAA